MSTIKTYRKKPVEIQAMQFDGWNWAECKDWVAGEPLMHPQWMIEEDYIMIHTPEGDMKCNKGDYIVKGTQGEFYPCKADIFESIYELVE